MNRRICDGIRAGLLFLLAAGSLTGCILIPNPTPQPATSTPTPADSIIPPTATVLGTVMNETATALPTEPTAANTQAASPTSTYLPTRTNVPAPTPTWTSTPSPTPFPYALQPGTPAYVANFAYPQKGCDWIGAAGQIFGADGKPQINLIVVVSGIYGGQTIDALGITGTGAGAAYGPGGYEVQIANQPRATTGQLTIQVFDLDNRPLTEAVAFNTYQACDKNLIIINFAQ